MRRFLDVLFQHLRWLALWLLVVPLIAGGAAFRVHDSDVVTARIHVDPAGFVDEALSDVLPAGSSPAQSAAALIGQLVQTDWFVARLAGGSAPTESASRPAAERRADLLDLRTRLQASAEGPSLVSVAYTTDQPGRGVALVTALLGAVGDALQTIESQRAAAALQAATGDLDRGRQDMQRATDEVNRYANLADRVGEALQQDPTYRRLMAVVRTTTDHYEELNRLTHQAQLIGEEVPHARAQLAVIVDPPRVVPPARAATAARYWLLTLVGSSAIGVLVIYVIALHDPRLRAVDDIRGCIPTAFLLSVPPE